MSDLTNANIITLAAMKRTGSNAERAAAEAEIARRLSPMHPRMEKDRREVEDTTITSEATAEGAALRAAHQASSENVTDAPPIAPAEKPSWLIPPAEPSEPSTDADALDEQITNLAKRVERLNAVSDAAEIERLKSVVLPRFKAARKQALKKPREADATEAPEAKPMPKPGAFHAGRKALLVAAVKEYRDRGFCPIILKAGKKFPGDGWNKGEQDLTIENADADLSDNSNMGLRLGEPSGDTTDIDLDSPEARALARMILPAAPRYGRASSRGSHLLVRSKEATSKGYDLPAAMRDDPRVKGEHGLKLLEIRSTNAQSMAPPSIHPSGEEVCWEDDGLTTPMPEMDTKELERRCGLLAFASAMVRLYPAVGVRDEFCLHLSGALARAGLSADQIDAIVCRVGELAGGGSSHQKRHGESTVKKLEAGEDITGIPKLCEVLGLPDDAENKFREWLRGAKDDRRPMIIYSEMRLPDVLDETQAALIAAGVQVYQAQGRLVRPMRLKQLPNTDDGRIKSEDGIVRDVGSLTLSGVNPKRLHEDMIEYINFVKIIKTADGFERDPIAPPEKLSGYVLARPDKWTFPVLTGIVQTPTMTGDGRVIDAEGYDAPSGIIADLGSAKYPKIPDRPTQSECKAELAKITKLYEEFPLVQDDGSTPCGDRPSAARSAAVSGVLTALIRKTLPGAPQNVWDAAGSGSGKTLGINVSSLIATGHRAAVISWDKSEEENKKLLFAALLAGDQTIMFDNVVGTMRSASLCAALTSPHMRGRVLGASEMQTVPTNAMFFCNGNNISFADDLAERSIVTRIEPDVEHPDQRTFKVDLMRHVLEHRGELIAAGLTVLRGWCCASEEDRRKVLSELTPVRDAFGEWSARVRGAIVWCGEPDPMLSREAAISDDPGRAALGRLLDAMWGCHRLQASQWFSVGSVIESAKTDTELREALDAIRRPDAKSEAIDLGFYFKRNKGRVVGHLRIEREHSTHANANRWRIVETKPQGELEV
jgi:hypothetical protein